MQTELVRSNVDISWMRLIHRFYQKKTLILLSTLLGGTLGFAIVFFSTPVYEAKITLTAPTQGDIAGLNQGRALGESFLKPFTVKDVYSVFSNELTADSIKEQFFKQVYFPGLSQRKKEGYSEARLYQIFSKNFDIIAYSKPPGVRFTPYSVALRGTNANQVASDLNQFFSLVSKQTMNKLMSDIQQQNSVVIEQIHHQIDIARKMAQAQRMDRITQLKEQVQIARLARERTVYWDDDTLSMDDANAETLVNFDKMRAEIKSLSARKSNDAFTPHLRELQAKLELYKASAVNPKNVRVFTLDGIIKTPVEPIAPKKRLVIMMSLVLGFLAGIFIIMFQLAWRKEVYGTF